jgi:hypothetical protein
MGKFLTADDRKELLEELRFERSRKYADRIRVIPISKNNANSFLRANFRKSSNLLHQMDVFF